MGHKRTRNRIPALPEAVKNLLALHSLEAWPAKREDFPRGARSWAWRVTKAGDDHINGRALFTIRGSLDLDYWLSVVQDYLDGKVTYGIDFETYGTQTRHWSSLKSASKLWTEEFKDIEARIDAMAKFP